MTNTAAPHITQLRQHLLDTLEDLRDRSNPMDTDRARAVASVAGALIDSARVEVDYIKATGADGSAFLQTTGGQHQPPAPDAVPSAHNPFPVSVRHVLGDK